MLGTIIGAIVIGLILGVLARIILPGKQDIPLWLTIVVGIVAAFVGTYVAKLIGIPTQTGGIDWLEHLVQLVLAVIGIAVVASLHGRRGVRS